CGRPSPTPAGSRQGRPPSEETRRPLVRRTRLPQGPLGRFRARRPARRPAETQSAPVAPETQASQEAPPGPALMTHVIHTPARVLENVPLATRTYRIRLEHAELARRIRPGQFVMLRIPGKDDPLLGRPFALYDTVLDSSGEPFAVDVVYLVV